MSRKEKKEQFLFSPQQIDSQPILNKKNIFLEYPRKRHIAHHDFNLADSLPVGKRKLIYKFMLLYAFTVQ